MVVHVDDGICGECSRFGDGWCGDDRSVVVSGCYG